MSSESEKAQEVQIHKGNLNITKYLERASYSDIITIDFSEETHMMILIICNICIHVHIHAVHIVTTLTSLLPR